MSDKKYFPEKTTLMLSNLHNAWLDEVCIDIRQRTGKVVSRSSLVRSVIAALSQASLPLASCESEEAIRKLIVTRLTAPRR